LTFANASLAQRFDYMVLSNITSSDHFAIIIQLVPRYNDSLPNLKKLNLKNLNWLLYSEMFEDKVINIKECEFKNTDNLVEEFAETIILVTNLTIGKTNSKNPKRKVSW